MSMREHPIQLQRTEIHFVFRSILLQGCDLRRVAPHGLSHAGVDRMSVMSQRMRGREAKAAGRASDGMVISLPFCLEYRPAQLA
jgi:hypothetical protein